MRAVSPPGPSSRNNVKSHGPTQPCREVDEQQLLEGLAERQGLEHKELSKLESCLPEKDYLGSHRLEPSGEGPLLSLQRRDFQGFPHKSFLRNSL